MLFFDKLCVGYQNTPKVASTSMFRWFYEILYGEPYQVIKKRNGTQMYVHEFFTKSQRQYIKQIDNKNKSATQYDYYYRFAITRDPIKRFISMYSNRVLHYRELSDQGEIGLRLKKLGLSSDPTINELVIKRKEYMSARLSIFQHTRPQIDFLGPDLSVYTRIADISEVDAVIDEIKGFWRENRLALYAEKSKLLEKKQQSKVKFRLNVLTPESFDILLDYYKCDYDAIPTLSIAKIREEYSLSLENNPIPASVVFPAFCSDVNFGQHFAVEVFWWNLHKKKTITQEAVLTGALVIKNNFDRNDFKLSVLVDDKSICCTWGLPSARIGENFIDNINAKKARFSVPNVFKIVKKRISLILTDEKNNVVEIASARIVG